MRYVREFVDNTSFTKQVLNIDKSDVIVLQKVIAASPYLKKLRAKYEKYRDIHEGGEATEKQEDKLIELEEELKTLDSFIKL